MFPLQKNHDIPFLSRGKEFDLSYCRRLWSITIIIYSNTYQGQALAFLGMRLLGLIHQFGRPTWNLF